MRHLPLKIQIKEKQFQVWIQIQLGCIDKRNKIEMKFHQCNPLFTPLSNTKDKKERWNSFAQDHCLWPMPYSICVFFVLGQLSIVFGVTHPLIFILLPFLSKVDQTAQSECWNNFQLHIFYPTTYPLLILIFEKLRRALKSHSKPSLVWSIGLSRLSDTFNLFVKISGLTELRWGAAGWPTSWKVYFYSIAGWRYERS